MRRIRILLVLALVAPAVGCSTEMVRAEAIKPAVDLVVPDYLRLKAHQEAQTLPPKDPDHQDMVDTAKELKQTVDLAAAGGKAGE